MISEHKRFMSRAIELAKEAIEAGTGGPFGVVIAKDGVVVAEGQNRVTSSNDPTAHAEIVAIREACEKLDSFQLDGCTVYASCEPCPMCLGAIYWARPRAVYYAATKEDAAQIEFDDRFIYEEILKDHQRRKIEFQQIMREDALKIFKAWEKKEDKIKY